MKTLLIALYVLASSCVWLGGNGKTPIKDTDSNIKPVTHDSVISAEAEKLSNPLLRVARYVNAGDDIINAKPGPVVLQGTGNTGNYQWYQQSGPSKVVFNNSKILKPTVTLVSGKYFFLLTGSYYGRNYRDSVKVIVSGITVDSVPTTTPPPVNRIPTVNAGPDKTITLPVNTVQLNAVATDPEGGLITYKWSTGETTASINPKYTQAGTTTYTVTVTDDKGASAIDNVVVLVLPAIVDIPPTGTNADPVTTPVLYNDFETSITKGFNDYIQRPFDNMAKALAAGSKYWPFVSITNEQKVSGNNSVKFVVNAGESRSGGNRHSQITKIDIENIKEGTEKWYSNDYYFASPYPTDIQAVRQWHHDANNYSPPLAVVTNGGKLQLDFFTAYATGHDVFYDIGAYPVDKWFHLTMHVIFSSDPNKALTEVWIDGVKKISRNDPNKFSAYDNITMFGLYKWIWESTSYPASLTTTIYADNYKEW